MSRHQASGSTVQIGPKAVKEPALLVSRLDRAEIALDRGERSVDRVAIDDVGRIGARGAAFGGDRSGGVLDLASAAREQRHLGACPRLRLGDGPSDAASGAGDDRDLAGELHGDNSSKFAR